MIFEIPSSYLTTRRAVFNQKEGRQINIFARNESEQIQLEQYVLIAADASIFPSVKLIIKQRHVIYLYAENKNPWNTFLLLRKVRGKSKVVLTTVL